MQNLYIFGSYRKKIRNYPSIICGIDSPKTLASFIHLKTFYMLQLDNALIERYASTVCCEPLRWCLRHRVLSVLPDWVQLHVHQHTNTTEEESWTLRSHFSLIYAFNMSSCRLHQQRVKMEVRCGPPDVAGKLHSIKWIKNDSRKARKLEHWEQRSPKSCDINNINNI